MNSDRSLSTGLRRSKERYVGEVIECVQRWRDYFENGIRDEGGNIIKLSLQQAAEMVNIPKKTLEDYYSILRKASDIVDLNRILDKKMGYLRRVIRDNKFQFDDCLKLEQSEEYMDQEQPQSPLPKQVQSNWDNMVIESDHGEEQNQYLQYQPADDFYQVQSQRNRLFFFKYLLVCSFYNQYDDNQDNFMFEEDQFIDESFTSQCLFLQRVSSKYTKQQLESRNSAGASDDEVYTLQQKEGSSALPDE